MGTGLGDNLRPRLVSGVPERPQKGRRVALALDSGTTLAEAAVLARHANAGVTGTIYAGISAKAKPQIAANLVTAGVDS
jgi:hypothetical protein